MQEIMDDHDGEVELSDQVRAQNPDSSGNFPNSASIDSFFDEFLRNTKTCTHTHTCNPPGPDAAVHTHTCYHTHTQVIASEEVDHHHPNDKEHSRLKPRRPPGNREAVRKYREKKKAHTAYLEEEVKKLRLINEQLARKLQGKAILEAEVLRLRSLLVDLKSKIDDELGIFPFQKQCSATTVLKTGDCGVLSPGGMIGLQRQNDLPCFDPQARSSSRNDVGETEKIVASWEGNCHPAIIDCQGSTHEIMSTEGQTLDTVEALVQSASQAE